MSMISHWDAVCEPRLKSNPTKLTSVLNVLMADLMVDWNLLSAGNILCIIKSY